MTDEIIHVNEELFLGRLDEQERFREILHRVLTGRPDNGEPPFIFLIYGQGGIGKSQLLRRLHDIAAKEPPFDTDLQRLRLDWEQERYRNLALQVGRDQIHPEAVLDALYTAAADCNLGRCFDDYRQVKEQRRQAEQAIEKALEREQPQQSRYSDLRDLGANGLAKLVRQAAPVIGQTGEKFTQVALSATVQAGAEGLAALRERAEQFARARLKPEQFDIYRQPHEQLARALGRGFKEASQRRPLVLLLDTYEIVAPAVDRWLRQVIKSAGPRVVWLLAGRDNLAASRPGDRYSVGYSSDFPQLLLWDVQELAVQYVAAYLADRTSQRPPTEAEAVEIHQATLGVPLALNLTADLWRQGVPLAAITAGAPDYAPREELVRRMCKRVLLHVEEDETGQADRRALYALAMQPHPDRDVLAAVLRPDEGPFDLNARLAELAGRYSVVQQAGGGQLHAVMGDFVREYLLRSAAGSDDTVKAIADKAILNLHQRRMRLEHDLFDLEERLESEDWRQTVLDEIHWLFWTNERAAWREMIPRFVEGLGYNTEFAGSLLTTAHTFKPGLNKDGQRRLRQLTPSDEGHDAMLTELERLAERGKWLDDDDPAVTAERHAILLLWRGRWQMDKEQVTVALQTCLEAERNLPKEATLLRKQLAELFNRIGWQLCLKKAKVQPSQEAELALTHAVELDERNRSHWIGLGVAKLGVKKYEEVAETLKKGVEPNK